MPNLFSNVVTSFNKSVSNDWPVDRLKETLILTHTAERLPRAGKQKIEFE